MNHGTFTADEHATLDRLEEAPFPDRVHAAAMVVDAYFAAKGSHQRALGGVYDWRHDIDLDELDMTDTSSCVAGQIGPDGSYYSLLDHICEELGEVAYLTAKIGFDGFDFFGLDQAWRIYLDTP